MDANEAFRLLREDLQDVRKELRSEIQLLQVRMGALESRFAGESGAGAARRTLWPVIVSSAIGLAGVVVAIVVAVGG